MYIHCVIQDGGLSRINNSTCVSVCTFVLFKMADTVVKYHSGQEKLKLRRQEVEKTRMKHVAHFIAGMVREFWSNMGKVCQLN